MVGMTVPFSKGGKLLKFKKGAKNIEMDIQTKSFSFSSTGKGFLNFKK